ncbi:MAG: SDR family oxidoreductase [Fervidicoccaceae archaeon]
MKILVIGASGFVGYYIRKYFNADGTSSTFKEGYKKLNIANKEEVFNFIRANKYDLIINSAAIANVDECEKNPEIAKLINGTAVEWISSASQEIGAKFVQISTDYVFDGTRGDYKENDKPNPINEYGKSKLLGEENAIKYNKNSLVLRIEMPYGINLAKNKEVFFETLLKNLSEGKEVKVAADQIISPTYVEDIPRAIDVLVSKDQKGIFHLASKEKLSRYDYAIKIAEVFRFNKDLIRKVMLDDLKLVAKRPKNTTLNTDKISNYFTIESLEKNLDKIRTNYRNYF